MNAIEDDARIGATHVSVYCSLLYICYGNSLKNPFPIKRKEVMIRAKIHSRHTYNICMNQLADYGYIKYLPSSNPAEKSQVYLVID
jgi:hypothetical protein